MNLETILQQMVTQGGILATSDTFSHDDIARAQREERFFTDDNGYGFIWLPPLENVKFKFLDLATAIEIGAELFIEFNCVTGLFEADLIDDGNFVCRARDQRFAVCLEILNAAILKGKKEVS